MAFVTVEDSTASIEILFFPKVLERVGHLLVFDSVIAVSGTLSAREDEEVKLLADRCVELLPDSEADRIPPGGGLGPAGSRGGAAEPAVPAPPARDAAPAPAGNPLPVSRPRQPDRTPVFAKLYLRVPSEDSEEYRRARACCEIFPGQAPAVFYAADRKEYLKPPLGVPPTPFVLGELSEILGAENVVPR